MRRGGWGEGGWGGRCIAQEGQLVASRLPTLSAQDTEKFIASKKGSKSCQMIVATNRKPNIIIQRCNTFLFYLLSINAKHILK